MKDLIRKLFGKKGPDPVLLPWNAFPSWLQERETLFREKLLADTREPVSTIRNDTANLQHIVNKIAGAEHDPAIHPKLKSIAKNSLPLFVKAMNGALAKEFPDDIDEFYLSAVEVIKNCLNNTRGQGRYLQIVFPEEMKAIRTGIDAIGREINKITTSLTLFRKEKTLIDTARALHTALGDIQVDLIKAKEKDQRITARIAEITVRMESIERELKDLADNEEVAEISRQKRALQETEVDRDTAARTYAALSMTASHVFRKAEKIAAKQKHPSEIAMLRNAIELLSDHAIPEVKDLSSALEGAFPIVRRMIDAEEILLKNKEERMIFADAGKFCADMVIACTDLMKRDEACRIAGETLQMHPLLVRITSLHREKAQLEIMLGKEKNARTELMEWRTKTIERIHPLSNELSEKIKGMVGESVQLQMDNQTLV